MPSKLITSAYSDAYGLRVPTAVSLMQLQRAWAESIPNINHSRLAKAASRTASINAYAVKNEIIPRENLTRLHNTVVGLAKAKPMALPNLPIPTYDAAPDYSLLRMIGVEFEGGWYGDRVVKHHLVIKRDGSVSVANRHPVGRGSQRDEANEICTDPECDWEGCIAARTTTVAQPTQPERQRQSFHVGELEFGPWPAATFTSAWDEAFDRAYPEEVNATCGQHVHISMATTGVYGAFVREDFREWLMGGLRRWADTSGEIPQTFVDRVAGRNHFCKAIYSPEQLWNGGDRYGQVNYCARKHGTMEVRVLPMFDTPAQSKAAITELVRLVAVWASAFAPRPRKPILIGSAEVESRGVSVVVPREVVQEDEPAPQGRWANFNRMTPINCPRCDHDVNACRGPASRNTWSSLARNIREWERSDGRVGRCCGCDRIITDPNFIAILTAIRDGEIHD